MSVIIFQGKCFHLRESEKIFFFFLHSHESYSKALYNAGSKTMNQHYFLFFSELSDAILLPWDEILVQNQVKNLNYIWERG